MNNDLENVITSDDILGRDAVDPEGEFLGIVMKLHIDRTRKILVGITIDQGFMRPDLYIGIEYVEKFGVDAVFLNRIPFEKYTGLTVYNPDGTKAGIISSLDCNDTTIKRIFVKSRRKEPVAVSSRNVSSIGSSVILKHHLDTAGEESADTSSPVI